MRIRLGGDDFIDPSSVRLVYTINETAGSAPLTPTSGPWGAWGQFYLRSNGVELDNIPQYGRFHQQYGWLHLGQSEQFGEAGITGMAGSWGTANQPAMGTIAAGGSFTVLHKLYCLWFPVARCSQPAMRRWSWR